MMKGLVEGLASAIDDLLMDIQRLFCRHKPMVIPDYAVVCEKCGKHLRDTPG